MVPCASLVGTIRCRLEHFQAIVGFDVYAIWMRTECCRNFYQRCSSIQDDVLFDAQEGDKIFVSPMVMQDLSTARTFHPYAHEVSL
jgi:hypothetical protein